MSAMLSRPVIPLSDEIFGKPTFVHCEDNPTGCSINALSRVMISAGLLRLGLQSNC